MASLRLGKRSLFVLAAVLLAGCGWVGSAPASFGQDGVYSGRLVAGGDYWLRAGEQDPAVVLLLGGSLVVEAGARLGGPLLIQGGRAQIDGQVEADVMLLNGTLSLGPEARLLGRLRHGGGSLETAPGAVIAGGVERGDARLPKAPRPSPGVALGRSALLACVAFLTVRSTPRLAGRVGLALTRYPVVSAAMGLLAGVTGLSLLVLMAFTIVLAPVSMLLFLAGSAAVVLGWIGLGLEAGQALARRFGWGLPPPTCAALGVLLLGLALEGAVWLPFFQWLPALLLDVTSLGAAMLTRFGLRTFIPAAEL